MRLKSWSLRLIVPPAAATLGVIGVGIFSGTALPALAIQGCLLVCAGVGTLVAAGTGCAALRASSDEAPYPDGSADATGQQERRIRDEDRSDIIDAVSSAVTMLASDGSPIYVSATFEKLIAERGGDFGVGDVPADQAVEILMEKVRADPDFRGQDEAGSVELIAGESMLLVNIRPLREEDEGPASLVVEWIHRTAEAQADALFALKKAEEVWMTLTPDGEIIDANENFESKFGQKVEEVRGLDFTFLIHSAAAETVIDWGRLKEGQPFHMELHCFNADMDPIFFRGTFYPVKDVRGNVASILLTAADASATQVKLNEMSAIVDGIMSSQATIQFDPFGKILEANDKFLATMEYSAGEIAGEHHAMFVPESFRQTPDYEELWASLRRGQPQSGLFKRVARNGRDVFLNSSYAPIIGESGEIEKVVMLAADVTDAEMERQRLVHSQEEDRARLQRVVDEFRFELSALADGDLDRRLNEPYPDGFEELYSSFNQAVGRLNAAIAQIAKEATVLNQSTQKTGRAAEDMARRTEAQATMLEQTAAAIKELDSTVKASSERSDQIKGRVGEARAEAEGSGKVVAEAVDTMAAIQNSSERINRIIGVIDDIAFQTNLLALNAGVEAARAGEAGRGFAVVASEVRALSQRCSEAAKEIKEIISASSTEVARGVELVSRSGQALEEIVSSVHQIDELVLAAADAAKKQAAGLSEVSVAIVSIDKTTQENASMAEEFTEQGKALAHVASELKTLTDHFRTSECQAPAPRPGEPEQAFGAPGVEAPAA